MVDTNSHILAELIGLNEKMARLIDLMIETQDSHASFSYQPWAMRMSQEFVCAQDMNGDNEIFGHTFYIDDLERYPAMLVPVRHRVESLFKLPDQGAEHFKVLKAVSPRDYVKTLTDARDRKAFQFIFGLEP